MVLYILPSKLLDTPLAILSNVLQFVSPKDSTLGSLGVSKYHYVIQYNGNGPTAKNVSWDGKLVSTPNTITNTI
jgi:hypothetical protein